MNKTNNILLPPRPIPALLSGFDILSTHLELLLFPIILDLWLWLGPHMRLDTLLMPIFEQIQPALQTYIGDQPENLTVVTQAWQELLQRMNLFSVLRTYPVGVPSLMHTRLPVLAPWTPLPEIQVGSWGTAFLFWLLNTLLGVFLGAGFFFLLAQAVKGTSIPFKLAVKSWLQSSLQTFGLALVWMVGSLFMIFPLSLTSMISGGGGSAFLCTSILLVWFLLPFVFSPHGIFMNALPFWRAILYSTYIVRRSLSSTSLFILAALIASGGLDVLWRIPAESSWFALIGILGHAVTSTALLISSFVFFRDAERWSKQVDVGLQNDVQAL